MKQTTDTLHQLLIQAGLQPLVDAYWVKQSTSGKAFKKATLLVKKLSEVSTERLLAAAYAIIEDQRRSGPVCELKRAKFKEIRDDIAYLNSTHPALIMATRTRLYMDLRAELYCKCFARGISPRDIELMTSIHRSTVRSALRKCGPKLNRTLHLRRRHRRRAVQKPHPQRTRRRRRR
jgi:hypothetical protein